MNLKIRLALFKSLCKILKMLPGYNHNLNVEGVVFHVQTEDRGGVSAYVETQVFVNGAIIHVEKLSYKPNDKQDDIIRLMQNQHKSVLKKLSQKSILAMERYIKK
ncbi:hypothetical protein MRY82_00875 [bacterium]|nr:hypothetical protein [bacterium]